ncbi:PAS domain-containing protein [Algoriphagus jejuensis]
MDANAQRSQMRNGEYDDLTFLAATICQVPISVISIETEGKNSIRSIFSTTTSGLDEAGLDQFFASSTDESTSTPVGKDTLLSENPVKIGDLELGFYAAISLPSHDGQSCVRLSILDQTSRELSDSQLESLKKLVHQAVSLHELVEKGTKLHCLEEALRDAKKRLHKIIDEAEVGIWEICLDTDEFRYSERWAQILGYAPGELGEISRAKSVDFVHPADVAESTKAMEGYRSGELPRYECELRMKHKKGYWVWILAQGEFVSNTAEYQGTWMVGTIKDTSDQVVAHEQIYVREKRFQILLENSEDAIIILNEAGIPHFSTESVAKMLGIQSLERMTTPLSRLVNAEDLEQFEGWFQKSLQSPKKAIKGPISRMRHSDGTWRHISGTLTNLLDDPIIRGLIYNFKDVSEQVLAEVERKRTENKYRKLAQEGADLVSVLSPEATYDYLSPNFLTYFGFTEKEIIGKGAFELIHPEDLRRIQSDFQHLLKTKTVRTAPFRYRHRRDGWRWVQSVATNLLDDPDIQGVVVNSTDVTDLIKAQKALEKSNERFQLVLKAGSESIYDYDLVTKSIFLSETFEETFGIKVNKSKSEYRLIYERIHLDDLDRAMMEFREAVEDPEVTIWTREYRLRKGDGTYSHVRDRSIKLLDASGKAIRVVGAMMDISEINFFQKLLEIEKEFIESSLVGNIPENEQYRNYLVDLESLIPGMKSSLSRVVDGRLCNAISPSLPEELLSSIDGLVVGPNQGSCGTAAFLNEKVFATDVFHDPRWENHRDLARVFGIGACWSFPIVDSQGRVVATIANYYATIREVEAKELQALERAHRLISLSMAQFDQLEKIRLSNERYELVNKTTNEAIFEWEVQKDRFHWGESFRRVFGHEFSHEEFNLDKWTSLMHPSDNLEKAEEWIRFLENKSAYKWQNEFRFLKKDGTYAFVEESAYIIRDEKGLPVRMIGVLRDRTEFKKMEVLLTNASKIARVGGWDLDVASGIQAWSPITCEIHEVPIDFTINVTNGIRFYREDYQKEIEAIVALAVEKGEKFDFEAPIITATGKERWVRSMGEAEFVNGQCVRIFGSVQDIHERKLMEERLKGVSDSIPGVIFQYILNPDGSDAFRYVSKGSNALLGLSPEECMADSSRLWSQLAQGGEMEMVKASVEESARTLSRWNSEWRVLSLDGKVRWREGLGIPNKKADGTIVWDALIMDVTDRKNMENLLEQSARMAKIGSWELALSEVPFQLSWSSTTRTILGLNSGSSGALDDIYRIFVGESGAIARQSFENLIQNGEGFDVELEIASDLFEHKWIRCIGQAEWVKGKTLHAYGTIQDIHDRKVSELNLKSLLLERNTILESIGDGFFAVNRDFTVTYWNKQAESLLGIPRERIVGKNLWDIFSVQKSRLFFDNYVQALYTGKAVYFEDYFEELKIWFSVSAFPSSSGLTVYFKDVTENKNAQEEIRQSNDRFERVSEATNDAIWDAQLTEDKLYWGKGFETLFGYDTEKFRPTFSFFIDRIHPKDRERILGSMKKTNVNPEAISWNEEYRFRKADGTYAYVMDRAIFTRDASGNPVRIIGAMADITERKDFENSLKKLNGKLKRQANELAISNSGLEQFAYVASHDLQEPLRMVSSFLSLLDRKYRHQLDEKAQQYIHFAVDGAIRMRQIILDLLEYSRVGKEEKVLEQINLEEVIFEITRLQSQLIEEKKAKIRFEGKPKITGFKSPILQIFQNLIGNALKYSRNNVPPVISISCKEEKNQWLIAVKDNGIGVKPEYYDKIFFIFQRLHSKDEFTGTGLGLAIVKKIIESLGGKIWLESVYGEGTTFYFTIAKPGN